MSPGRFFLSPRQEIRATGVTKAKPYRATWLARDAQDISVSNQPMPDLSLIESETHDARYQKDSFAEVAAGRCDKLIYSALEEQNIRMRNASSCANRNALKTSLESNYHESCYISRADIEELSIQPINDAPKVPGSIDRLSRIDNKRKGAPVEMQNTRRDIINPKQNTSPGNDNIDCQILKFPNHQNTNNSDSKVVQTNAEDACGQSISEDADLAKSRRGSLLKDISLCNFGLYLRKWRAEQSRLQQPPGGHRDT